MKIVICGASGFAGTTVTHWLSQCEDFDIVPVIGSGGSAWALAKDNVNLVAADVMNRTALAKVLKGCDALAVLSSASTRILCPPIEGGRARPRPPFV